MAGNGCCASAATGQATAPPAIAFMKLRRRMTPPGALDQVRLHQKMQRIDRVVISGKAQSQPFLARAVEFRQPVPRIARDFRPITGDACDGYNVDERQTLASPMSMSREKVHVAPKYLH